MELVFQKNLDPNYLISIPTLGAKVLLEKNRLDWACIFVNKSSTNTKAKFGLKTMLIKVLFSL
jgi:hypothetical protein